jgi:hypothetical protein
MFVTSKHTIEGQNFEASARKAIQAAFKKNGYAPNAVLVLPNTTELKTVAVGLGTPPDIKTIPVTVRDDLSYGFGITAGEFLLDVCDPNSPFE